MDRRQFIGGSFAAGVALVVNENLKADDAVMISDEVAKGCDILNLTQDDVIDVVAIEDGYLLEIRLLCRDWQQRIGAWLGNETPRVTFTNKYGITLVDAWVNEARFESDVITLKVWADTPRG